MIIRRVALPCWFIMFLSLITGSTAERFVPQQPRAAAVPRVSRPGYWLWSIAAAARGGSTEESDLEDNTCTARELLGSDEGELMDNDDTEDEITVDEAEGAWEGGEGEKAEGVWEGGEGDLTQTQARSHYVNADSWFEEKDDIEAMVEGVHSEVRVDDAEIVESYIEEADKFEAPRMEDEQADDVYYDVEYEYEEEEDLDEIPTTGLEPEEEEPPELVQQDEEQSIVDVNSSSGNSSEMEMAQHHTTDDDSAAFVDRMDLADAYDEGEPGIGDVLEQAACRGTSEAEVVIQTKEEEATPSSGDIPESVSRADANPLPSFIDSQTEKVLRKDLKFRRYEVKSMRPEIAVVVAQKRLRRPLEGMPRNWYKSDVSKRKQSRMLILDTVRLVLSFTLPVLLSGLTIYGYLEFKGGRAVDEPTAVNTESMSSNAGEAAPAIGEPVPLPPSGARVERRSF
jgi:hypothetical protein